MWLERQWFAFWWDCETVWGRGMDVLVVGGWVGG